MQNGPLDCRARLRIDVFSALSVVSCLLAWSQVVMLACSTDVSRCSGPTLVA